MTQGEDFQFQNCSATESAAAQRKDHKHERQHAGSTVADVKTPDRSALSEFLAPRRKRCLTKTQRSHWSSESKTPR